MKEQNVKYYFKLMRQCLLALTLVVSVFAFSGYNTQIESAFQHSVRTEIVKTDKYNSIASIEDCNSKAVQAPNEWVANSHKPYASWTLLNLKLALAIKYKMALKVALPFSHSFIDLSVKLPLPSVTDEEPSLSVD